MMLEKRLPVIYGLCKVRNESKIIQDTLDAWVDYCTGGIFLYDDCSEDNTVEIAKNHNAVHTIIQGKFWDPNREKAEWFNRQLLLTRAKQEAGKDDWFVYFDADEFLHNFTQYELFQTPDVKAIACRLYDLYITPEDKNKTWKERQWIGPEFRTIPFFFKNSSYLSYNKPDQRIVDLEPNIQIPIHGDIIHISKGQSVEDWEKMCDYYAKFWPKYSQKWQARKGKAVKENMLSDFGNKLIKFEDRKQGFSLEDKPYGLS